MQGRQGGTPKSRLSLSRSMKSSVTVVVLGVIGLLAIMQWTSRTVIKHVTVASQSLFSAALMSQRADTAFQRMNREYRDAAVLQERASLETAAPERSSSRAVARQHRQGHGIQSFPASTDYLFEAQD